MIEDSANAGPRVRPGPINWLTGAIRAASESVVSNCTGHRWRIRVENDYSEFSCQRAAIVSDGSLAVFVKYSTARDAGRQFEIELAGLQTLATRAGVLTPEPLGITSVPGGHILILRALEVVERGPEQWKQIGSTLARIHRVAGTHFGYERDGFWGPLFQDNSAESDWAVFFRDRRLLPLLKRADESGNIPAPVVARVEKLAARVTEPCGPGVVPTLLHGDAQQNNFLSTAEGTYVIDPAVYFGHPEMDLALIDSWQPVPAAVFDSYRREMPIDSGFSERRDLWRIPLYLAAVALEGRMHLNRLTDALKSYE